MQVLLLSKVINDIKCSRKLLNQGQMFTVAFHTHHDESGFENKHESIEQTRVMLKQFTGETRMRNKRDKIKRSSDS